MTHRSAIAGQGGGAAWTPASLPGIYLWWSGEGLASYADGAGISTWPAQVGPDGTQATELKRPACDTAALNGHPVAVFDATHADFMSFARTESVRYVAWLLRQDGYGAILGAWPGLIGDASTYHFLRQYSGAGASAGLFDATLASPSVIGGTMRRDGVAIATTAPHTSTAWTILSLQTTGACSASTFSEDRPALNLARSWYGALAQIIIATSAVSDDDAKRVEGYLAWYGGLAGNLPEDHPHKSAPPDA